MRDLLCIALNELVEKKLIDLKTTKYTKGNIYLKILGKPSKILWDGLGSSSGEVILSVWWGIKTGIKDSTCGLPLNTHLIDALEVACSVYIERKDGAWMQGEGGHCLFDTYCSKTARDDLLSIGEIDPSGYAKEGKFYR